MKKLLLLMLVLVASCAYAEPLTYMGTDGFPVDVSTAKPFPVTGISDTFLGYVASITLAVDASATVKCPNLGTATKILVWTSGDCNFGGSTIVAGSIGLYIPGDCPLFPLSFSTSDPGLWFRSRAGTVTVILYKAN